VRVEGADEHAALRFAARIAAQLRSDSSELLKVLGPAPAPLARLRGRYRFHILLKAPRHDTLRLAIEKLAGTGPTRGEGNRLAIDVDPVDML
jgi:primosomal protein N' (replication factor Y)